MSDRDVEHALTRSIQRRVQRVSTRVDTDELFMRFERRHKHQARWVAAICLMLIAVAAGVGFLVGNRASENLSTVVAAADGVPADPHQSTSTPANVDAAVSEIIQAFHDAYDGGTPVRQRMAAVQEGAAIEPLRLQVRQYALARGYTETQLADLIGVSTGFVSLAEKGEVDIPLYQLMHVADLLLVSLDRLVAPKADAA